MADIAYEARRNDEQRTLLIEAIPRIEAKLDMLLASHDLKYPPESEDPLVVGETVHSDETDASDLEHLGLDHGTMAALEEADISDIPELRDRLESGEPIEGVGEARMKKIRAALERVPE